MKIVKNIVLPILLISLILLSIFGIREANVDATFYLLRHAEKQNDGTKDPHLTEQGQQRAEYLAQQLSLANITKIYSTDYHRTQETAKPLSELLGVSVESYNPRNLEEFAEVLNAESGSIVIVGHSNTTPTLAALLSGQEVDGIDESEYENLYQIVSIGRKTQLNRFKIFPIDSTRIVGQSH
jgi:broad specificity phosphatase PhoE